ncbi:MAG: flavodoxin domain-containing protein [Actinobacteria bacterium]|nr:flavodoxin domain-containing protein [Actinomycetota bacterium]
METRERPTHSILVTYATTYGATKGIAEHIAARLQAAGAQAEARPMKSAGDLAAWEAVVVGSAVYNTHWTKEATAFVTQHHSVLSDRPVWLFSSGPLGTATTDPQGRELTVLAEPKELAAMVEAIHPRGHQVFFGAHRRSGLGFAHRAFTVLPAARALLPEGDFRDWPQIEAWAEGIAAELSQGTPDPQGGTHD